MGILATLTCASLLALSPGNSPRAAGVGLDDAGVPLVFVVIDTATGAPLPEADVRWLPLTLHDAALGVAGFDWPRDREAAVLRAGSQLTLDARGCARIDAPLGGLIVLARTDDRYLLREVASGAGEVALALEVDVRLTVTFLQPSGAPLVGVTAGLCASAAAPESAASAPQVMRGTTDSSGAVTFDHVQTKFPELGVFIARGDPPPPMHIELDVVGARVGFPLDPDALEKRAATFTAPPLGVVSVRLLDVGDDGRGATQAAEVRPVEPGGQETRGARFTGAVDGVLRRWVPLGRRFEVRALDRRVLGLLTAVVDGPRAEGEVVDVGPLVAGDHAELRLVTGLSALDLPANAVIRVSPGAASQFGLTTMERVLFGPKDLGADGELLLVVPREFFERSPVELRVTLWADGHEQGRVDVTDGVVPGGRIAVPLAAGLAATNATAPASATSRDADLLVTGFVVDAAGRRVPGARITVLEDDPAQQHEAFRTPNRPGVAVLQADATGAFELRYETDAQRFQLRVGGAGFDTPQVLVVERGARDLCVTLGATTRVFARVSLDEHVPWDRVAVVLEGHADFSGARGSIQSMRHLGRGHFVVETTASGPAALSVRTLATVRHPGQAPQTEPMVVARAPLDLGVIGGGVHAPDIDLRGRLVRIDPRAVDAASGVPSTDATYALHVSALGTIGDRTLYRVPVGEATYVPTGAIAVVVDAPDRLLALGKPGQREFVLRAAPRLIVTVEDEHGAPPPDGWQFRVQARLLMVDEASGPAALLASRCLDRDRVDVVHDGDGHTLTLRQLGRWALTCTARRHAAPHSSYAVPLDVETAHVVVTEATGAVLTHRVSMAEGSLARLMAMDRPPPAPGDAPPVRSVVDLEVLDILGRPIARREVQGRWVWSEAQPDGQRRVVRATARQRTDALGRVALDVDGVPLEHGELEFELVTDPEERPQLYARACWSARERPMSAARPPAPGTTVAGAGAVRLVAFQPAVAGRVLDHAGRAVAGARVALVEAPREKGASNARSWWFETRVPEADADGRYEVHAIPGSEPFMVRSVELRDGSARLAQGDVGPIPPGARDVVVLAERLATAVVVVKLAEGLQPRHLEVALVRGDGTDAETLDLAIEGSAHRYVRRGVEPGTYSLRVSVADRMEPLEGTDPTRLLHESASTSLAWEASGPTVFPTLDLTGELALTQVTVALHGAPTSFFARHESSRCIGVFALDGTGALQRGADVPDVWFGARSSPPGRLEVVTRSRAPLALEVAGTLHVPDLDGTHRACVVRGERVLVGVGVPVAEVALEEYAPLRLSVSEELVEALGPHHLYAIAWRNADDEVTPPSAPTATFGMFDAQGELVLTAPEPRPGMGETTVEVELVLVSNLGGYTGDLAEALDFPRVRKEAAFSGWVSFLDEEVTPQHVPRAERLLERDAHEEPIPWRRVLDTTATAPIQLDVDVAAVGAARTLLE